MNRRIQIRELPLVSRNLTVRMLKLFKQQEPQLLLRELRINERERDAMKGQIPGGEPRILPLVRHRQHAHRVQVQPTRVATAAARLRRRPVGIVAVEPNVDVIKIDLLTPEHAGESLPLNATLVFAGVGGMNGIVELVGLRASLSNDLIYVSERRFQNFICEAQMNNDRAACRNIARRIMKARLRTYLL